MPALVRGFDGYSGVRAGGPWVGLGRTTAQRTPASQTFVCPSRKPVPLTVNVALWPLPLSATNGSSAVQVVPASAEAFFTMSDGAEACSTLSEAFARYTKLMFPHPSNSAPAGKHGTPLQAKCRIDTRVGTVQQRPHVSVELHFADRCRNELLDTDNFCFDLR